MRGRIFFVCLILFSCSDKIPGDVLKPEKMQAVLWDYMQVENYVKSYIASDSAKNPIDSSAVPLQRVYKKHKVTREEFNKSLQFYASNDDFMQKLLDTMEVRNRQAAELPQIAQ